MIFISGIKEKRGEVPAAISTQDVEEALKDLRNSFPITSMSAMYFLYVVK